MDLITVIQTNPAFFYVIIGITGLLVGSFLNVVIYRLPIMMEREWRAECSQLMKVATGDASVEKFNLILPRSACPSCGHKISALENIPIISFVLLGGRCRGCKNRISWRYPLIEATSCVLVLVIAFYFGPGIKTMAAILFTWALIALTMIDYDHQLLPDTITLPFLWLGILCNMFGMFTDVYSSLFGAIFGYLILWGVYIVFKLVTGKEGMGRGDFKLLAMLGAWLGWQMLPFIIIVSSILGSVVGVGLILFKAHNRSQPIPFGPYLALAGWLALLYGRQLTNLYYNWALT
jgi:leader peptidase (prepilin peptidase)/N-methyltransferase